MCLFSMVWIRFIEDNYIVIDLLEFRPVPGFDNALVIQMAAIWSLWDRLCKCNYLSYGPNVITSDHVLLLINTTLSILEMINKRRWVIGMCKG